jgi:DNA-binding Lrp family transcriptional regulator
VINVSLMSERFGRTPQAVSPAVQKLVELGILSGPYGNYGRQYIADDIFLAVTAPPGRIPLRDEPLRRDTPADPSRL